MSNFKFPEFTSLFKRNPVAVAYINGSVEYPDIQGRVGFYQTRYGVVVVSEIKGLPLNDNVCNNRIYAYHIHDGSECEGDASDPFAKAGMHYNPNGCEHPYHAGDLPPLFNANGYAFSVVLSDRFAIDEIINKTIVIHSNVDDFTSRPSGNAGTKIACGLIYKIS